MRVVLGLFWLCGVAAENEDERLPNKCEVCKFLTIELQDALEKTGHSREVLEVGEVLDTGRRRRKIKYNTSETRLTEAIDNICERILQYNVHAERSGSLRYGKGASQTMTTLKNLVHKGVKVDLGLPYELWDEPSVEVSLMKKQCETMLEQYEEVVEDWYFHHQDQRLERFLCEKNVLQSSERECLKEVWKGDMEKKRGAEEVPVLSGDMASSRTGYLMSLGFELVQALMEIDGLLSNARVFATSRNAHCYLDLAETAVKRHPHLAEHGKGRERIAELAALQQKNRGLVKSPSRRPKTEQTVSLPPNLLPPLPTRGRSC
ncbi:protein canopy 4 [Pholidichthys leucotaenia]